MTDDVIRLTDYLGDHGAPTAFSVVGGEGERSRFALPVWRAVYLLDGERGAIAWASPSDRDPRAYFVLDLKAEPARTDFAGGWMAELRGRDAPSVEVGETSVAVLLARDEHRSWYLVVEGRDSEASEPGREAREDLLFLAGECAGLLLHRSMGSEA